MKAESGGDESNGRRERIKTVKDRLGEVSEQVLALADFDVRKQKYNEISEEVAFYEEYIEGLTPKEEEAWYETVNEIENKLTSLIRSLTKVSEEETQAEPQESSSKTDNLLAELVQSKHNLRFGRFVTIIEGFGFRLDRIRGSHHIFKHPRVRQHLNVQEKAGKAKLYQIIQFLKLVERYSLRAEE